MRIFCSSCDVGSSKQNLALVKDLLEIEPQSRVIFVTEGPSSRELNNVVLDDRVKHFDVSGQSLDAQELFIRDTLERFRPHFGLLGLSVDNSRIDEISLKIFKELGLASAVIQDYWGYLGKFNNGFSPDFFFVMDQVAKDLTSESIKNANVIISGSPKHSQYKYLLGYWREKNSLHLTSRQGILFVAQPRHIPGIRYNFGCFCTALAPISESVRLRVRLHPADLSAGREFLQIMSEAGIRGEIETSSGDLETELMHSDVVVTCFSTAGIDHNYLQLYSAEPLGRLIYLNFGSELQNFMKKTIGRPFVPGTITGLGVSCTTQEELTLALTQSPEAIIGEYFSSVKTVLNTYASPAESIYEVLVNNQHEGCGK